MPRQRRAPTKISQIILILVAICGGLLFLFSGLDPLGLFSTPTPTTAAESSSGQGWWEVYFSDPLAHGDPAQWQGSLAETLITFIDQTQTSLDIAAFEFNLTPIAEALLAAKQRGVTIRWMTDDENGLEADGEPGRGQFALLQDAGIPIRDDARSGLMHNKFIIFDNQTVWTGSTNLTQNGIFENNNNVIVIHSPEVAAMFEREFAEMWQGQHGVSSPSTVTRQAVVIEGTSIQVLFAPEDQVASWLIPLVESASKSIRFMAFSFTSTPLGDAMLARAQAGVTVEGIFETRGSETEYSELPLFYCAGLAVRQDGNPSTFHHKVILIDDKILVTGSYNFSESADKSNDENTLLIDTPQITALFAEEFDRRWAEAHDPDPAKIGCR